MVFKDPSSYKELFFKSSDLLTHLPVYQNYQLIFHHFLTIFMLFYLTQLFAFVQTCTVFLSMLFCPKKSTEHSTISLSLLTWQLSSPKFETRISKHHSHFSLFITTDLLKMFCKLLKCQIITWVRSLKSYKRNHYQEDFFLEYYSCKKRVTLENKWIRADDSTGTRRDDKGSGMQK